MNWLIVAMMGLTLGGCASTPDRLDATVALLDARPTCKYKVLGEVKAQSGRTKGHRTSDVSGSSWEIFGEQARPEVAASDLQAKAAALGANAVIVQNREYFQPNYRLRGSLQKRADSGYRLTGLAIVTTANPRSDECTYLNFSRRKSISKTD